MKRLMIFLLSLTSFASLANDIVPYSRDRDVKLDCSGYIVFNKDGTKEHILRVFSNAKCILFGDKFGLWLNQSPFPEIPYFGNDFLPEISKTGIDLDKWIVPDKLDFSPNGINLYHLTFIVSAERAKHTPNNFNLG